MLRSGTIKEITSALAKVQGELGRASKSTVNPFFKSKYADLNAVMDVIQKPLSDHGLALVCTLDYDAAFPESVIVETTLMHESGEWLCGKLKLTMANNKHPNPQEIGSMITYGRRYSIMAMLGLASEDDDGNIASGLNSNTTATKIPTKEIVKADAELVQRLTSLLEERKIGIVKVLDRFKLKSLDDISMKDALDTLKQLEKTAKEDSK